MTINPMSLSGKNIIVTGASSGIGLATSHLICALGGNVAMVSRNKEKLSVAQREMPEESSKAFSFDLRNTDKIPDLVSLIRAEFGPIGGLVHCAGDFAVRPLRSFDPKEYRDLYDLHVTAFFMLSKAVCTKKKRRSDRCFYRCRLICGCNIWFTGLSMYSSVKGALISAVRSLAAEYATKKIRFNCVCPGWVNTPMLDRIKALYPDLESFDLAITKRHLLGLGQPDDVSNSICFLLSDAARWITGTSVVLDGGYSL
ncbi:SDR family oxidoreductase [Acetomicrobium sp.]|uniref:SDR family NAD(P)-dependent oxidoreductase n=1 Tax=Acetomicrobium sp. TaxID=1872099 RepID=UPI002870C77B|nr:SDR family oxidoreductase [Acetomicrobium sp.]MDR9768920.1 SDR family oxidoreductase [Acetomicrobium sp.]